MTASRTGRGLTLGGKCTHRRQPGRVRVREDPTARHAAEQQVEFRELTERSYPFASKLNPGDWILIQHGRWSRGVKMQDPDTKEIKTVWMVESESILLHGDYMPDDYYAAKVID
jgi:hypothetical protein